MPLTVKDILEKTFKRSFKGYDEDEVDKFLDQIIDEFKALQNEVASLRNEAEASKAAVEKIKHSEETIMNTLVSAQKTAERMLNDAKRKAEVIVSSAEATAKQRAEQTLRQLDGAKASYEELQNCAQGFATSFANMINSQAAYFEKTYKSYFGQDVMPLGGMNTDALDKIDKDIARSLEEMGEDSVPPKDDNEPTEPDHQDDIGHNEGKSEYMELFEINKKLSDFENEDYPPESSDSNNELRNTKQYSDYSWLYESDEKSGDIDVTLKDPKDKEELKSLIDEIIE